MSLHHLGSTRSRRALDHLLQTPDTFVWAALPGMVKATACVHASPALGAGFTQYTVVMENGGRLGPTEFQRFVYVLEGEVEVSLELMSKTMTKAEYMYLPAGVDHCISTIGPARLAMIEKPFVAIGGASASALIEREMNVEASPLMGDAGIQVRVLMPAEVAYDFAVNTMEYKPGARLGMVEVHVMEHGLLMLEGEGIYRLGESWYPVTAGDFIWMAPFCPQWFGALGDKPARYLIYKDWNRHPLQTNGVARGE